MLYSWSRCDAMTTDSPSAYHYNDVIMTTVASQITSLTVVYSTVYSDADQRKHQSSASLAFVREIHRDRWIPRTKGQLRGKCFHLMTSSWCGMKSTILSLSCFSHLRVLHHTNLKFCMALPLSSCVVVMKMSSQYVKLIVIYICL